jgi:hypothetical protein
MIETRQLPVLAGMTVITLTIAQNMAGVFSRSPDSIVATVTTIRSTGEYSADMTIITLRISMSSGQREACNKVVELPFECRKCLSRPIPTYEHQHGTKEKSCKPGEPG